MGHSPSKLLHTKQQQQPYNGIMNGWAGTCRTLKNINSITILVVLKFLTSTPNLPSQASQSVSGQQRRKKHEEPEDKNPHFLYTRLILDMMRPLHNRWSPLTHVSHCMTTSRPAAATLTRATVSPYGDSKVFLRLMPFLLQPSLFRAWGPAENMLACIP